MRSYATEKVYERKKRQQPYVFILCDEGARELVFPSALQMNFDAVKKVHDSRLVSPTFKEGYHFLIFFFSLPP